MLKLPRLVPRNFGEEIPSEKRTKFINDHIAMKRIREQKGESSVGGDMQPPTQRADEEDIVLAVPVIPTNKIRVASTAEYDFVKKLGKMRTRQFSKFKKTIFGEFLNMPKHKFQGQVARCLLEREVVQSNPNEFWVYVGGSVLKFTLHEFALVTGLKCSGSLDDFVDNLNTPCPLMSRFFPASALSVRKSDLTSLFEHTDGIVQQPSGSLDCGLFTCAYAEFLSDQTSIPQDLLDVDLLRTRYGALLWDYGVKKVNNGYVSDNDNPKYPREPYDIEVGDDLVDLT